MTETVSVRSAFRAPNSALVFDAVGTLIYAEPSPAAVYERIGRTHGSRLSGDEIGRRFRTAFAAEEAVDRRDPEMRTSEDRERRRWQTIVAAVLDDVTDPVATFDELWRHFARPDAWRPFADAAETVPELVRRGYTVSVASNFDARLHAIIAAHFPMVRREHVFVSSEVGYRKPAVGFFRQIEACLPQPSTLIGDDVENDLFGAQSAGWPALLIDRDDHHSTVTTRLRNLCALLSTTPG